MEKYTWRLVLKADLNIIAKITTITSDKDSENVPFFLPFFIDTKWFKVGQRTFENFLRGPNGNGNGS